MPSKILLTGATGRIGSRLAPRLVACGHAVRALVRSPDQAAPLRQNGIDPITGDLREDATVIGAVRDVDVVVHAAAAFRGVAGAEMDATNVRATTRLADAAAAAGVTRFVFASTNLVYGTGADRPARESDAIDAEHPYPRSKAAAEAALIACAQARSLDVRILRFAFVYGDGDPHLADSIAWLRNWPSHKRLHMLHHRDVAGAVSRAIAAPGTAERVFNIADDCPVTAYELMTVLGAPVAADAATRTLHAPWESIVDTTLARTTLGFHPAFPTIYQAIAANAL